MKNLRETKKMRENGITLVVLVITIIILLILAGISISALTNTGIFQKAKDAKQKFEDAENEQNKILDEYETELNQYNENTLVYKVNNGIVKIGDYVAYTPDDASTEEILNELKAYSGSRDNTDLTLTQEKDLNWRVLDVKDGHVRLISEKPTESKIYLNGYNAYNNAVKLLDNASNTLYNNLNLAKSVQNIKIEDIQDKIVEKDYTKFYSEYGKTLKLENKWYPSMISKEKDQKVNTISENRLNLSEQDNFINQVEKVQADTVDLKCTFWYKKMEIEDFADSKYYELFINNGINSLSYWMSSRCIQTYSDGANFNIRYVSDDKIYAHYVYDSYDNQHPNALSFRPIVTLNSNVKLDITNSGDGTIAEKAWAIKK